MMFNPAHPGEVLLEDCVKPMQITITQLAKDLGVTRKTISDIVNQHSGISPEMALKLARAFNTTPELWINMQRAYDLWHAQQRVDVSHIRPYPLSDNTKTDTIFAP